MSETVLIVGAGKGLSASLGRKFYDQGMSIHLAARNIEKLEAVAGEVNAGLYQCDASKIDDVANLFSDLDSNIGTPDLVIYNPSSRLPGGIADLDPHATLESLKVTCFGAFLIAQQAASRMQKRGGGSIFFTGASAGVKAFPNSSVFAMGKFGLRALAQSLARELHPQNIHIGHFVIDGGITSNSTANKSVDRTLDPDAIAQTYLDFFKQHRSAWAWEIELRPWVETF